MNSRIRYQLNDDDGVVLPIYPADEIQSDAFELKLARWLLHHDPQVCRSRLAALEVVMYGAPSDCGRGSKGSDYVQSADRFGVSLKSVHVAYLTMPHIPSIHVGWKAGYNSGRSAGLRARGMTRSDPRTGVRAMLQAKLGNSECHDAA